MGDITLEQVINVCGNYNNKNGYNYNFACPICREEGHDSKGDNLVYNAKQGIIKCFFNNEHTFDILDRINNTKGSVHSQPIVQKLHKPSKQIWEERQEQYVEYMHLTQKKLLDNKDLLVYIYNKRGLRKEILDIYGVGFDDTENCFTIPIFSLKHQMITDFELRLKGNKKQIRRIGGGCSTVAKIYGRKQAKTLFITEGFIDGMTLVQWLLDAGKTDFTVYSCSNGAGSLYNCLSEINFSKFEEIKLILDNDKAGDEATAKIIERYPFIKDARKFLAKDEDINKYYVRKIING